MEEANGGKKETMLMTASMVAYFSVDWGREIGQCLVVLI